MKGEAMVSAGKGAYNRIEHRQPLQSQPPESKEHLYERMRDRAPQEPFIKRFIRWWRG